MPRALASSPAIQCLADDDVDLAVLHRAQQLLAEQVEALGRTAALRLAAGPDKVGRTLVQAPGVLKAATTPVRRRLAYAALALASPGGDQHARLAALQQVAAERRRRRDRLLALRRGVAEAVVDLPSLQDEGWQVRRALAERTERVGAAVAQAGRLVARLGPTVLDRRRRQGRLRAMADAVVEASAAVPSFTAQAAGVSATLSEHRSRLALDEVESARHLKAVRRAVHQRLLLAGERLAASIDEADRVIAAQDRAVDTRVISPARGPHTPRTPDRSDMPPVNTPPPPIAAYHPSSSPSNPARSGPHQDIGRSLIEWERARRAATEVAAPTTPSPSPATEAPTLTRRVAGLFAKRAERPGKVALAVDSSSEKNTPIAPARPVYSLATGDDPARTEAIKRAVQAIEIARSVPMRRAVPADSLEIVTNHLATASPLRAAALLEDDPQIQAALALRRDGLVAIAERHLALKPARDRATLFRQMHLADPHAAQDVALLFSAEEITAMAAQARATIKASRIVEQAPAAPTSTLAASDPARAVAPIERPEGEDDQTVAWLQRQHEKRSR